MAPFPQQEISRLKETCRLPYFLSFDVMAAQFNLGFMYFKGQGVPQDYVRAHMWFNLAAVGGDDHAAKVGDLLSKKMTASQIAEAQKLAREWKPKE